GKVWWNGEAIKPPSHQDIAVEEFGCREKCARLIHRICRRPSERLGPSCWREARGCGGQDNCGGKATAFLSAYPGFQKLDDVLFVHDFNLLFVYHRGFSF